MIRCILKLATLAMIAMLGAGVPSRAASNPPDILVLGDSQFAFGSGGMFHAFFRNIAKHCRRAPQRAAFFKSFERLDIRLMGVRATALHHWSTGKWSSRKMVCMPDPKWAVNARLYGFSDYRDGSYVQIGQHKGFDFCRARTPALKVMFRRWAGKPRLLFLYFLGNAAARWGSRRNAATDVRLLAEALPPDLPCIFMTTSPTYSAGENALRRRAQRNIRIAFEAAMNRCLVIDGIDDETVSSIQGRPQFFRRRKDGRVRDAFHLNSAGARHFLALKRTAICDAVARSLMAPVTAHRQ